MKHHQNLLNVHYWCCSHVSLHAHGVAHTRTGTVERCQKQTARFSAVFPRVVHNYSISSQNPQWSTPVYCLPLSAPCCTVREMSLQGFHPLQLHRCWKSKKEWWAVSLSTWLEGRAKLSKGFFLTSLFVSSQSDGTFAVHEARTQSSESTILSHTHPFGLFTMTSLNEWMQRWPSVQLAEHNRGCSLH